MSAVQKLTKMAQTVYASRCWYTWDRPWKGHGNAVLSHHRCKAKTTHPSGYCRAHRNIRGAEKWCMGLRCENRRPCAEHGE